jgi:hypothetical protein
LNASALMATAELTAVQPLVQTTVVVTEGV